MPANRGGQYCVNGYRPLRRDREARRSPSRRGDCHDHARAASRWSRLETGGLDVGEQPVFAGLADVLTSVADYVGCHNPERQHSSSGYQAPYHAHQQLLQLNALPCPA
ncbi:hypothetical protein HHL22_07880 [Hymenobacter sp. RP-2-7]|uniref:Integrase catalytic domain-containing protein n=1 Tax=Hymenobacter polaris TaxID=2682546 RepID=A0A7Y0AD44_9BACT|nr:hypothetical protein [Hymenobacter polaris]NML65124.1 hypothetical protein [Hymenobacter polaris]